MDEGDSRDFRKALTRRSPGRGTAAGLKGAEDRGKPTHPEGSDPGLASQRLTARRPGAPPTPARRRCGTSVQGCSTDVRCTSLPKVQVTSQRPRGDDERVEHLQAQSQEASETFLRCASWSRMPPSRSATAIQQEWVGWNTRT